MQQSKVILLSFLYDFWDRFIEKKYYDIMSCDTDCYDFAIAKECLEDMVDSDKLDDFKKAKSIYLCDNDDMKDLKTPGKWKMGMFTFIFYKKLSSAIFIALDNFF